MITHAKTTYQQGFTLRTEIKVGTIQGSAERIYREAEMRPRMTRKDLYVLGWMLLASGCVVICALWGLLHFVSVVMEKVGL